VWVKNVLINAYHSNKWLFLNNIKLEKNAVWCFVIQSTLSQMAQMSNKCNCQVPYGKFKQWLLMCKLSECKCCKNLKMLKYLCSDLSEFGIENAINLCSFVQVTKVPKMKSENLNCFVTKLSFLFHKLGITFSKKIMGISSLPPTSVSM
jgi:hypothetical protein